MKPMLARTVGPKFNSYPCYVQPKLNGIRALFQKSPDQEFGVFQSRDEKLWAAPVLKHLLDELSSIDLAGLILDGELYRHGWRLQNINGAVAVNRSQPRSDTHEVCFHVFDVVDPRRKFSERWFEVYHGLIQAQEKLPHLRVVPTSLVGSWPEVEQHFHMYTLHGYEGIMLRPDGIYEFGEHRGRNGNQTTFRSQTLWKHKHWEDDEFVCLGTTSGEGKAEIGIGALLLESKQIKDIHGNHPTFKVGTGFTDEDRIAFAQDPPIGKMVRVRYLCLTADGIPFNPSFIAVL